jgi:hypothetical protein
MTLGGSVQRPLTSGHREWLANQNPWPAGPTLQPLVGWLHGDTLQEVVEGNPKLTGSGGQTPWLTGHVARPANHHLACYRLNQVGNLSMDPYKYLPTSGNQNTTLIL